MVDLLNNHILLPDPADWSAEPDLSRAWQTAITDSLTGPETRAAFRSSPRRALSWTISPRNLPAHSRLDDRIRAAKKLGRACTPHWGLSSVLVYSIPADLSLGDPSVPAVLGDGPMTLGDTVTDVLTLQDSAWPWSAGDYVFLRDSDGNYETALVAAVATFPEHVQLTLSQPPSGTYAAGLQVWPILFGKFLFDDAMEAIVSHRGQARLTLTELTSPQSIQLGAVPGRGTGIGSMIIETDFIVA